jgi:TolA-binding protein
MRSSASLLKDLFSITEQMKKMLSSIHEDMDKNNTEDVEAFLQLVQSRESVIEELNDMMKQHTGPWNEDEKKLINQLQMDNQEIQAKLEEVFDSFSVQVSKVQQSKKISKRYINNYENTFSNGFFIDKKK